MSQTETQAIARCLSRRLGPPHTSVTGKHRGSVRWPEPGEHLSWRAVVPNQVVPIWNWPLWRECCHLSSPLPTSHPCIPTWQHRCGIGRGRILPVMVDCDCQGTMKWFALCWYIIMPSFKNELIL